MPPAFLLSPPSLLISKRYKIFLSSQPRQVFEVFQAASPRSTAVGAFGSIIETRGRRIKPCYFHSWCSGEVRWPTYCNLAIDKFLLRYVLSSLIHNAFSHVSLPFDSKTAVRTASGADGPSFGRAQKASRFSSTFFPFHFTESKQARGGRSCRYPRLLQDGRPPLVK